MPILRDIAPVQAAKRGMEHSLGLTPGTTRLLRDLVDLALPYTGPAGTAASVLDVPEPSSAPAPAPSLAEQTLRASNPLYGAWQTLRQSPELAMLVGPLLLGKAATAGQKTFKRTATALRKRLRGSAVRQGGKLRRVYHGTTATFERFDPALRGQGGGGDLYGPGYYFTEDPGIAGGAEGQSFGYATGKVTDEIRNIQAQLRTYKTYKTPFPAHQQMLRDEIADLEEKLGILSAVAARERPNVRPAYLNITKPFDIEAPADPAVVQWIHDHGPAPAPGWGDLHGPALARDVANQTNHEVYNVLAGVAGGKEQAQHVLKSLGYDGITHIGGKVSGGKRHRVWIAFEPEQVIPAFAPGAPTHTRTPTGQRRLKDLGGSP